ncbi:MAG: hypothetical protein FWJ70_06175 [Micromonosporaceae bacterium]
MTQMTGDRVVNGHYQALPDPVQEDLLTLTLNLAAEVWTLRDRLRLLQSAFDEEGLSVTSVVERRRNDADQIEAMKADRDAFVRRLFRGVAQVKSPYPAQAS